MKIERFFEWILSIPVFLSLWGLNVWLTHQEMVKESPRVKCLKMATYSEIKEKMISTEWDWDARFPSSLFTTNDDAYFHASIFEFKGVGYLLTPYGYVMTWILQRKIRKQIGFHKKPYVD